MAAESIYAAVDGIEPLRHAPLHASQLLHIRSDAVHVLRQLVYVLVLPAHLLASMNCPAAIAIPPVTIFIVLQRTVLLQAMRGTAEKFLLTK